MEYNWEDDYREALLRAVDDARTVMSLRSALKRVEASAEEVRGRAFTRIRVGEFAEIPAFVLWLQEGCTINEFGVEMTYRVESPPNVRSAYWWALLVVRVRVAAHPATNEPQWEWEVSFSDMKEEDVAFINHVYRACVSHYKLPQYHTYAGKYWRNVAEV